MPGRDILVVGSINFDLLVYQTRLPSPGETFLADAIREDFGGKGANQAVQCARLGQEVTFIGAVGRDERGRRCLNNLRDQGIECHVAEVDTPTGLGLVHVVPSGEVYATITRGANGDVTPELIKASQTLFDQASFVVLQNEIAPESNDAALECATQAGAQVVYNAAPARPVDRTFTRRCAFLVLNEEEARFFLGKQVDTVEEVVGAAEELLSACDRVVVTLGAAGSVLITPSGCVAVPAVHVPDVVDTTGAGDAFVGAFVAALNEGEDEHAAARMASLVAALSVSGSGAQTSMPTIQDVRNGPIRAQTNHP